jgi:hypothetical protein
MADRDAQGRFVKGWKGGPGRPPAASVHEHRAAMVEAVTPSDIAAIMRKLVAEALDGDVTAARIVLERFFGRPADTETLERIERLEELLEGGGDNGQTKTA